MIAGRRYSTTIISPIIVILVVSAAFLLSLFSTTSSNNLSKTTTTTTTTTAVYALAAPMKVVVSGAGGQTGQSLFRQLLQRQNEFEPLGLVRSEQSKQSLVESGVDPSKIAVCDITDPDNVKKVVEEFQSKGGNGDNKITAFCIATSAKPQPTSEVDKETGRPVFDFPNGQPEVVDWVGQKNQIDACPDGCHVVICSTMGGSDPNHPLNNLGKKVDADTGKEIGGNIVRWKRKAEMYLIEQSPRLEYTITHPGGLLNEPGGQRELVVGVDDDTSWGGTDSRTVCREDVARVMLEAVRYPAKYGGRSFDLRSKSPEETKTPTTDFEHLLDPLDGKNCDYKLGAIM
eukprot:CAMPEP_0113479582 /NCGR_PEP_ID=MMETSP0014_2-20120614/21401_1 /TAXON_ID=2857 /ORGANISM="Nitzschia sp." /LENGTH=343 /DNA_ID=CAMNT_0000372919 /DNA_START=118 /DNA_END=1149 /DNA_ORIENTATION=- /assembly_acc=CAM_ASM_000159